MAWRKTLTGALIPTNKPNDNLSVPATLARRKNLFTYVEFVYVYLEVALLMQVLQPAGKFYAVASLKQFLASSQTG